MTLQRKADLLLVLTTLIAACGWIFSREAIAGMPVFAFLCLRFLGAAACLLPFCRGRRIPRRQWRPVLVSGLWMALSMCLWIYSVATTLSLGEGAFIMSLSMLFVPLVSWGLMKARPLRAFWECLPVAMVGLGLLSLRQPVEFHASQGWFLLAAIAQAIAFCHTSRCAREVPLIPLTTIQLACTGFSGLVLTLIFEEWSQPFTLTTGLWLLVSIFIATCLRFGLQLQGQKHTTAANAAIIMILEPLLTVIAVALWYGEQLPAQQIIGGILILLAQFWYRCRTFFLMSVNVRKSL
ncbi:MULTISPECIES: DMT family transporter [unclassified Brenneria]|uniref:DMT family transporter n=1 Tax=unclassified Brenneria TaxID=2634434 RepID=UPI0018F07EC4|nr:DMT family transporter [Brenneria sp. L3-3C-1]MBJ7221027.1 DMT family transporter [Brenneria sp. L3-3C-1]MEE3642268.1 DMT family transporter [Brenneria sp. L3_3C_1]